MANYAQTVNVIGAIKTTPTAAELETTGLVLKLYRRHYGVTPVEVSGAPVPLDVAAAWTSDKSAVTVAIVNPTDQAQSLALKLGGAQLTGEGTSWVIANPDRLAHNDPGKPRVVDIREEPYRGSGELNVPALGVALFELRVKLGWTPPFVLRLSKDERQRNPARARAQQRTSRAEQAAQRGCRAARLQPG